MPLAPMGPSGTLEGNVWTLVAHSGPVAKTVLLILLVFSVVSWAIILEKVVRFRKVDGASRAFRRDFAGSDLAEAIRRCVGGGYEATPLRVLLVSGVREGHGSSAKEAYLMDDIEKPGGLPSEDRGRIERAVERTAQRELQTLEKHLVFLASTANATPFIGLFGTVWGVMDAFLAMGMKGSTNLATVGPGIAEALIATVAGLAAAIPAVVAYNHFLGRIRNYSIDFERFGSLLADRLTRR
ncbi:MAG: MotA/TolQ/ExbB proton channel family protein [Candidatus Eisenbacteria bacterium]|nr:MotA/TolQ/ExbB proton channel family protein [Candidatus Eisenbacteria bacterium]